MSIPEWVYTSIFYQIFPDRFANGDPTNDPPNRQPWGTLPDSVHFQGGDLLGIQHKLDYLVELGVNAIYLNPIFQSPSTHRYNTVDYYQIDPKLGGMRAFKDFVAAAHDKGMRVILDGVFNHCARGFFAFNDILENESVSPYLDWFHVQRFPLMAYSPGKATNYSAWWGYKSLPKFNTNHPPVRKFIFDVAKYWIDQGIDGWRLDVPNEINDDGFWAEYRQVVRSANPDAYLVGEIWDIDPRWANDSHFDGLMNYPVRKAILALLTDDRGSAGFIEDIQKTINAYSFENVLAMYSLLGSHDVERIKTLLGGSTLKTCLANTLLFGLPGVPGIYYGDEIGVEGGRDPDCRRAFPWDEQRWDQALLGHIKKLTQIRMAYPALQRGQIEWFDHGKGQGGLAWLRTSPDQQPILVVANPTNQEKSIQISFEGFPGMDSILPNLLDDAISAHFSGHELRVNLPAWGGGMFVIPG